MTVCSPTKASLVAVNSAFPMLVRGQAGSFEGGLILLFDTRVSNVTGSMIACYCIMLQVVLVVSPQKQNSELLKTHKTACKTDPPG